MIHKKMVHPFLRRKQSFEYPNCPLWRLLLTLLPAGQFGAKIVRLAVSRLGDPYSQPLAGQGHYTDCSCLTQWCYRQVGIFLPRTAAEQEKYCVDNGLTISPNDLEPGDLIFFSLENNERFMNISHVAIVRPEGRSEK